MATTTRYPTDLLPSSAQDILTRYPRTISWLLLAGSVEVWLHTVAR